MSDAVDPVESLPLRVYNLQRELAEARERIDKLAEAVKCLQYWHDISECDCQNPLPQGGCLKCDLVRILSMVNGD